MGSIRDCQPRVHEVCQNYEYEYKGVPRPARYYAVTDVF